MNAVKTHIGDLINNGRFIHSMLIGYGSHEEPLQKYFNHYFNKVKVGLVTSIVGSSFLKTGTGKSYTALKMGQICDKDFGIHKVVYYPRDFLKVMDLVENNGKPGQVVVVDEGEVTAPAHLWQNFTNRAIGYNLATFRYLRCMSIFVSPSFAWMDKKVRQLTNHLGYSEKTIVTGGATKVKLRLYRLTTDNYGEKIYMRKIKMYNTTANQIVSFKSFAVSKPSEDLCERYELKAREFKVSLRQGLIKDMEAFDRYQTQKKDKPERVDVKELLADALANEVIQRDLREKGRVTNPTVRNQFENLSYNEGARLKNLIELTWSGKK